jgi:hypothetical protein
VEEKEKRLVFLCGWEIELWWQKISLAIMGAISYWCMKGGFTNLPNAEQSKCKILRIEIENLLSPNTEHPYYTRPTLDKFWQQGFEVEAMREILENHESYKCEIYHLEQYKKELERINQKIH